MLVPILLVAGLGGVAYWAYKRRQGDEQATNKPPVARPPKPPIPPPPPDVIMTAGASGGRIYTVSLVIKNTWDDVINDTFVFYNEAAADTYYSILKAFFDDPYVHKAYTYPTGTIMVHKAGTPPSETRIAMYNQDGPMAA